jgi:hypothetical protein
MYIEGVTRLIPSRRPPRAIRAALAVALAGILSGCNLFDTGSPSAPVIARPSVIQPESDAFLYVNERQYTWTEELVRPGKADSMLGIGSFKVKHVRDTLLGGSLRPFFDVSASFAAAVPAPAGLFTRLGFNPQAIHFDTARVPDPGAALRFPVDPVIGWRLDTVVGDLRFVRVLTGTAVIEQSGLRYDTWAFAESTWWAESPAARLSVGTTWIGRDGLVKHQTHVTNFTATGSASGTLQRTLIAP